MSSRKKFYSPKSTNRDRFHRNRKYDRKEKDLIDRDLNS